MDSPFLSFKENYFGMESPDPPVPPTDIPLLAVGFAEVRTDLLPTVLACVAPGFFLPLGSETAPSILALTSGIGAATLGGVGGGG